MRRRNLVSYVALAILNEQWSRAIEQDRKEYPTKMKALYEQGSEFYCPNCGDVPSEQVRQEERDETCLYVCRKCDAVVDEPIPF